MPPGYGPARAACPEHGVRAGRVPRARHGSRHARDLGDWVACLAAGWRVSAHSRIVRECFGSIRTEQKSH